MVERWMEGYLCHNANLYSNQHIHTCGHFNVLNSPECTCELCGRIVGCLTFTHWFVQEQHECPLKLLFRYYDYFVCMHTFITCTLSVTYSITA